MRRFFGRLDGDKIVIEGDELKHLTNVIRLTTGDKFIAVINDEYDYICEITKVTKKQAIASIIEKSLNKSNPDKEIVLFQALTKREAFETIVQKACELGASKVVPFVTEYV